MKLFTTFKITILLITITISQSLSQGTLKGVVTDSLSNKELIGANVFLVGTSVGAATDIEGKYFISSIPEGKYTVKVSYIGYKAKELEIQIPDNITTELNIQLSLDVLSRPRSSCDGSNDGTNFSNKSTAFIKYYY